MSAPPSSVAPSDSASRTGKKSNRPGKNARARARENLATPESSVVNAPSPSKTAIFAAKSRSDPVPTPGKYPIVFPVGVGEPTKDRFFSYSSSSIHSAISDLDEKYVYAPRFAEFASYTGYTDSTFQRDVMVAFLLGLAQQTVFAHQNMGLPQGDFGSVSSTDLYHLRSVRSATLQFGEYSVPSLGTRFLLKNYETTVSSLVYAASKITVSEQDALEDWPITHMWLPMRQDDSRTRHILAVRLVDKILTPLGVQIDIDALAASLVNAVHPVFDRVKHLFGNTPARRNRFDFLFNPMPTPADWVVAFASPDSQAVLTELGLVWDTPVDTDLDFAFQTKLRFSSLYEDWARKRAAITKFFSCGASSGDKSSACGSPAQMSLISRPNGATVVSTMIAVSAPEYSLASCFPPSSEYIVNKDAVVTTTIPINIRAIEFTQLDWLS
jgi:hypothetical protein